MKGKVFFSLLLLLGFVLTSSASIGSESCWFFPRSKRSGDGVDAGLSEKKGETGAAKQDQDRHLRPAVYWNPLAILDNSLREMDREFRQMETNLNSFFRNVGFSRWSLDSDWDTGLKSEIVEVPEGDKNKYLMNVFVGDDFKPEHINMTVKDRVVTIDAKRNETSKDGHSRVYQEVVRRFTLPEKVNVDELKSVFSPNGVLKVEAPIPKEAKDETEHQQDVEKVTPPQPQEIPITKIK